MSMHRTLAVLLAGTLATSATAQSANRPLNLKLPPGAVPAASSSAAAPAAASTAPGVYYGDTSGTTDAAIAANEPPTDTCDDATYNATQMHGSVGMGVVAGSRFSGNYQTGTVNLTKAFGDCDHPTGGVSISIGAGQGHFDHDGRRFGR
ncbi:hypothetical protein [Dyella sp.]|jgi:hypothetical protein|uniref:hypothetical protein n=1 Tax=Dyella sp. TaxID=1869338 RepID=UPI002D797B00|nr:hypothetical protein [Dyella sp.]HET6432255.1 hypothetical protein [Dyella sp.]